MIVLGFESSCDETGVALVSTDTGLLAHTLHSQIAMHQEYGGVVPELASRDHIRRILPLTRQLLDKVGLKKSDIDVVAYTAGPGLVGALLVGASFAQAFAWSRDLPAVAIHHLEGHLLSPLMADPMPEFPFVALLVSGGHTQLIRVDAVGQYELLGETLDDAAGEAFDKTATLLGLGYPGGPALSRLAQRGDAGNYRFPRPMLHSQNLDFSFSGLKTAVLTQVRKLESTSSPLSDKDRADLAASTEDAIVDVLASKSLRAMTETGLKRLVVAGGVGANRLLRERLVAAMDDTGGTVYFPPVELCTDNGAMIAFAAAMRIKTSLVDLTRCDYSFTVRPRWDLSDVCLPPQTT